MTKLIITLNSLDLLEEYENIKYIDRYIVGNSEYAVRVYKNFTLSDIKEAVKKTNKDIYVNVNKIFHQKEIAALQSYLKELQEIGVAGIIFSDFAVLEIVKELNWKVKLSYCTDTTITSSSFTNQAKENGIDDIELAKEITLKEILEINANKKVPLVMFIHGHIYMYNSFRKLVDNYQNEINSQTSITNKELLLYDEERDVYYPIIENQKGTNILSAYDQSSLQSMFDILKNEIDYLKLDSFGYKEEDFYYIVNLYVSIIEQYYNMIEVNASGLEESIKSLAKKLNKELKEKIKYKKFNNGFLKKKTVY